MEGEELRRGKIIGMFLVGSNRKINEEYVFL